MVATPHPASLLAPVTDLVASVLAGLHHLLAGIGLPPDSGAAWLLAVLGLVLGVRTALLPVAIHGVRTAHAAARARPRLAELAQRYEDRRDVDSLQRMAVERREINAAHGVSRLGCPPALVQIPVLFALYRVLVDVSNHRAVGAMTEALVGSADAASVAGLRLADTLSSLWGAESTGAALVVGLVVSSVLVTYLTQRLFVLPLMATEGLPEMMVQTQQLLPLVSAAGIALAGAAVPVGVLVYWLASNVWTLAQQGVIWRFAPTPGSPAYAARSGGKPGV